MNEIEVKTATFLNKSFPLHFHKVWSLGFITNGSEYISFNETDVLLSKDTQILIPPYSLHKNWGSKNSVWTYRAIYLNSELIRSIAKELKLDYSELASFPYFVNQGVENFEVTEGAIIKVLENIFLNAKREECFTSSSVRKDDDLNELLNYLSVNYNSKITLGDLENKFKINKYKLLRIFKNKVGVSPLEYQMSIRIEKSKQLFFEDIPLTHIALESGFFDQSHFTHSFKRYVGVTPGDFKNNCNILQDQGSFIA